MRLLYANPIIQWPVIFQTSQNAHHPTLYYSKSSFPWRFPVHFPNLEVINLNYHTRPIVSRRCGLCLWIAHSSLVMNILNPFMNYVTSLYVFKPRDVTMLLRAVTIDSLAAAPSATLLLCCVPLNGMFHQDSATRWNKLRNWKLCNYK